MQKSRTRRTGASRTSRHLVRRMLRWVVSLHGSRRDIALGFSIGIFVAFSPTIGFQMIIAAFLATLVGASRTASIVPVWITNPLTIAPIYGTTYYIGGLFWPGTHDSTMNERLVRLARRMDVYDFWEIFDRFHELAKFGYDVLMPMTIGGIIVGLFAGAATYPVTHWLLRRAHAIYQRRRHRRSLRRKAASQVSETS